MPAASIQTGTARVRSQLRPARLLDGDNDSPLFGSAKNERTLMAYNFFSLTREHQTELPRYDDGKFSIEVKGTERWHREHLGQGAADLPGDRCCRTA